MSINSMIINALKPLAPIKPDFFKDPPPTYFTFNYSTIPDMFGDDGPGAERYLVQVHLYCPLNYNSLSLRDKAKQALFRAGFTWPNEADGGIDGLLSGPNEGDDGRLHRIFEFETAEGVDYGGP